MPAGQTIPTPVDSADSLASGDARPRDLQRTEAEILRVATERFADVGYYGARVDDIATRTSTSKRMIYYCFGSKDGLFRAVLRRLYAGIREHEQSLQLADLEPREAIHTYVAETFRYHATHPELARIVGVENTLSGVHLAQDEMLLLNGPVLELLADCLRRGVADGVFRAGVAPLDIHLAVSSQAVFRVTNAATIKVVFGHDMNVDAAREHTAEICAEMVLAWLAPAA